MINTMKKNNIVLKQKIRKQWYFRIKKKPFEMSFKLKFEGLDGNTHRKCNRNIEEYFSQKEQQE